MDWLEQEAALLALGAISGGCSVFLSESMPGIYAFFLQLLHNTSNSLLFRIAGWTVSQFADWMVESLSKPQMDELMSLLLSRMNSDNSQVQLASSNCVSVLVEHGEEKITSYYDAIIKTICHCFTFYGVPSPPPRDL